MGGLFKKRQTAKFDDDVVPMFPDVGSVPPDYFELFQLAGNDQLTALRVALKKLPAKAVQVRIGPQTLLHCACQNGAANVVSFLLEQGLDKNLPTSGTGVTPLHYALQGGHGEVAEILLESGADPNKATSPQDPRFPAASPLHFALLGDDEAVIRKLLEHGANPEQRDAKGQTPVEIARRMGKDSLLSLMNPATDPSEITDPEELARIGSQQGSVAAGMQFVAHIEALAPKRQPDEISGSLGILAINLSARSTTAAEAQRCYQLFQRSILHSEPGAQAAFSNALRHAASNARPASIGYEIAQLMKLQPQFAVDLEFREAYANTLFNISVVSDNGAYCNSLAQEISGLPGFPQSPTMQFNCGRILSNAAGMAKSGPEARGYAETISKLPLYSGMPQLQEASERAFRNCSRFD